MGVRVRLGDLLADRRVLIDTFGPPLVFVAANGLGGLGTAAASALGWAAVRVAWRLARRERAAHALAGMGGVAFSVGLAVLTGEAAGYFIPGIVSGLVSGSAFLVSVLVGRPLVAVVAFFAYGWPLGWSLHPRVRPAFREASLVWATLYLVRSGVQTALLFRGTLSSLVVTALVLGWPASALAALVTYRYVPWRIDELAGPSIVEHRTGTGAARRGRVDAAAPD